MQALNATIKTLRRELRASMGDRNKLSKLHSEVTVNINNAYGEEKEILLKFRQEVRDALNSKMPDSWERR